MLLRNAWFQLCHVTMFVFVASGAFAQTTARDAHPHTPGVSGVPQGVPFFCANPTVSSVASGAWSNPATWSTKRVPGANDKVAIGAGHDVAYDAVSDAKLTCIELRGHLAFSTTANTRMNVGTIMVFEEGHLEIGRPATPVAPEVTAEIVILDQPLDPAIDPGQLGTGITALGKVTMHGSVKTPTFVRLSQEPLAGHTTLSFDQPVMGWKAGDHLVIPDTRQLRANERGSKYASQAEKLQIASVSGSAVTLAKPLAHDHKGARNADGKLEFLPHVANVSRNVIVRSENPQGTRGHTMFISHADVDLRYAQFLDLGRTRIGVLRSTEFDSTGQMVRTGTNQIGRYAIHFHHAFGPKTTPSNGYQFTAIGNAVDGAPKWGITVHNSHYGLLQDNVVYNTGGAGIVTEDGTESFNVFDHNFSMRSRGSGDFALNSGYGPKGDPGGEGGAFWFRGPNNIIRNNVAANSDEFGFGLAAGALDTVRIPAFKGADTSKASESLPFDTTTAPVLEFANNEAYGAMQTGIAFGWNGTISNFTVWHPSRHAVTGTPTAQMIVDRLTARGDVSILADPLENPVGVWFSNYVSKTLAVTNANVHGMRVGVSSPFFYNQTPEPGRPQGSLLVENGYFRTYIGVNVATAYRANAQGNVPLKNAVVRSSIFEPLKVQNMPSFPPETISMNFGMSPSDSEPRDPILVYDYNKQPGNNFKIYYSFRAPETVAPCHETMPGIGGWVCR